MTSTQGDEAERDVLKGLPCPPCPLPDTVLGAAGGRYRCGHAGLPGSLIDICCRLPLGPARGEVIWGLRLCELRKLGFYFTL